MYQLLSELSRRDLLVRQLPSFSAAFLLASAFYRFGSFALESIAFLGTWYALDAGWGLIGRAIWRKGVSTASHERDDESSS